jgi:hypothetical protein
MKMKSAAPASVLSLLLCAPLAAQVVPNGLEDAAGNYNLGVLIGAERPTRHQQVYAGAEVQAGVITSIYFRQDETFGTTAATCTWTNATVILSSTTVAVDALSTTFADNLGADATVVFQGDLVISNTDTTSNPRPFEYHIPFTTPFTFDSSTGLNLVVDITLPDQGILAVCMSNPIVDTELTALDSVSSVFCWSGSCSPTFDTASATQTSGIVTLFVQELFHDGFESGDTTEWTSTVP